jgi:hypothetical protein
LGKRERRWYKRRYNTILRKTASHLRGEVAEWSNAAVFLKRPFTPGFSINFLPASEVRILPSPLLVLASNDLLEEATGNIL